MLTNYIQPTATRINADHVDEQVNKLIAQMDSSANETRYILDLLGYAAATLSTNELIQFCKRAGVEPITPLLLQLRRFVAERAIN